MEARYQMVRNRFCNPSSSDEDDVVIRRQTSLDAVHAFPDNYFDWIYIDGNHLYEHVKKDLECYYPKVRPNGIIAGDDYCFPGWWDDGVTRAVDEFCASPLVGKLSAHSHQFILRKVG
jgi:predicted O-methyltransferase YrrM